MVDFESANKIIDTISMILNKNNNNNKDKDKISILSQLDQTIQNELAGHIFETTCYNPLTMVVAHAVKKQVLTCKIASYSNGNDQKIESLKWCDVIMNVTPEKIVRYESPLNGNNLVKYQIEFVSPSGKSFTTKPKTSLEIVSELRTRGELYKPRIAEEALNAILNGAQRDDKISTVRQIETPGFYYVDGKIVSSDVGLNHPTTEDIRRCAEFLNELICKAKHPEKLVTELKWGMLSLFSFVFKQP